MTEHLTYDTINHIALCLAENVYGSNGDLDREEILEKVIEDIHATTDYQYAESGMLPVRAVASLIRGVWEYMDREYMNELGRNNDGTFKKRSAKEKTK